VVVVEGEKRRTRMMKYSQAYWDSSRSRRLAASEAYPTLLSFLRHLRTAQPNAFRAIPSPVRLLLEKRGVRATVGVVLTDAGSNIWLSLLEKDGMNRGGSEEFRASGLIVGQAMYKGLLLEVELVHLSYSNRLLNAASNIEWTH